MVTDDSQRFVLLDRLGEEYAERYRRGERPALRGVHRPLSRTGRRHPRILPGHGRDLEQVKEARAAEARAPGPRTAAAAGAAGRLPDPPRDRPRRHGGRLRGRAGLPRPARRARRSCPSSSWSTPGTKQRFEREARAAARLHHTNIVPVFGVGEHEGLPYYVMQFIQGLGLDEVLEELKRQQSESDGSGGAPRLSGGDLRVSPRAVASAAARRDVTAADMARLAVERPVRDRRRISKRPLPSRPPMGDRPVPAPGRSTRSTIPRRRPALRFLLADVLIGHAPGDRLRSRPVRSGPPTGRAWPGSASRSPTPSSTHMPRACSTATSSRPTSCSTPPASSGSPTSDWPRPTTRRTSRTPATSWARSATCPPRPSTARADARGDVYSLGLTLYELLALRPAFEEKERNRLIKQVTTEEPARLDRVNPEVPRDLVTIVHKAIERDPAHRYRTAGELMSDLQRFLDDEPIQARRHTHWERSRRWAGATPGSPAWGRRWRPCWSWPRSHRCSPPGTSINCA